MKQTLKQRKTLRSEAARNGWVTRREPSPVQDAAQERAIGFSDGVRITTDFYEGCIAMKRPAREMVWGDLQVPEPPAPPPVRLCCDCLHSEEGPYQTLCKAPGLSELNLVTGTRTWSIEYAKICRDYSHLCGRDAVHFEPRTPSRSDVSGIPDILRGAPPKPSLWQRIKRWWA